MKKNNRPENRQSKRHTAVGFAFAAALAVALLGFSSAHAQSVAISSDGVTFPDTTKQTSAVIVPMNCPHGDSIVWDVVADNWVCKTDLTPIYAIGDSGPAGGIVFYLDPSNIVAGFDPPRGTSGLEAAPADQSGGVEWGCYQANLQGADGTAVGTGAQNTLDILAGCGARPIAANAADAYVWPNGQTDGFLPSKDEMDLMYDNLHHQSPPLGGFANDYYWSSSEISGNYAWYQLFLFDDLGGIEKNSALRVRAARAF